MEKHYILDYPEGSIYMEVSGHIAELAGNTVCLVNSDSDIETIKELINACGYTHASIAGKHIVIIIEDYELYKKGYASESDTLLPDAINKSFKETHDKLQRDRLEEDKVHIHLERLKFDIIRWLAEHKEEI